MTPDAIKSAYRRMMNERGETIIIRRYTGSGENRAKFDAEAMAVVSGYAPQDLVGSVIEGDRKLIVLAEDLVEAGLELPLTENDKAVVQGRELQIFAPDASTRRVSGVLIAYELQARG